MRAAGAAVIKKVLQQLRPEEHQESLHGHSPLMDDCHPLMNLLVLLSKRDMLPAIIFNFNRSECDCMGEALLELLEHLEGKACSAARGYRDVPLASYLEEVLA